MYMKTSGYGANLITVAHLISRVSTKNVLKVLSHTPLYKEEVLDVVRSRGDCRFGEVAEMTLYGFSECINPHETIPFVVMDIIANIIRRVEGIDVIATRDVIPSSSSALYLVVEYAGNWGNGERARYQEVKVGAAILKYMSELLDMTWNDCQPLLNLGKHSWTKEVPDASSSAEKEFYVDTPIGKIRVKAKGESAPGDHPGVYVDFCKENGEFIQLACTEYAPNNEELCSEVFPNGDDVYVERFVHHGLEDEDFET